MRVKKVTGFFLAVMLAVTVCVSALQINILTVYAESPYAVGLHNYFYNQLTDDAKVFYNAMVHMYDSGLFKTGTASYDLSEKEISQETLKGYMNGRANVLSLYGAARDAFYADYPSVFYVDFSSLSVRMTKDREGKYHLYLGTGRYDTYYTQGFSSTQDVNNAVTEYEAAVKKIVDEAKAIKVESGKSLEAEQIKYVHDYITKSTSYRLENVCDKANIGFVRTSYGALVKHQGVCEAYTRAFKAVMDQLGIPCVMVQGVFRHTENTPELHIWNYVQLNGNWYGVDATMDDPIGNLSVKDGVDGYENHEYLLVGQSVMDRHHVPSSVMSEANYEFYYPTLAIDDFGVKTTEYTNGLTVKYKQDGEFEDIPAGEYRISFNGMGYKAAAEKGYYMIAKFHYISRDKESKGEWVTSNWGYITPELYPALTDTDEELYLPMPHVEYAEFGVTDIAPGNYYENVDRLYYQGDPCLLIADSGMLHNPTGTYQAPPYPKNVTPSMSGRLNINGSTYHVQATYDDDLVAISGQTPNLKMECEHYLNGKWCESKSALENSKIDNFKISSDNRTVSFDFTPSEMWADDSVFYKFYITGVVGEISKKAPLELSYGAAHPCAVCAYKSQGYDWNVFGKPALLENTDLSTEGWVTDDGTSVDEMLKSRMVLVASSPTHAQTDKMNELLDEKTGETVLKSETYNINLTLCKKQIIKTGQGVRVSLGFPEGYGPDDEGVTFKAYHFIKNDSGEVVGVEEIPCVITRYGLIITCDAFSPFAIVAVEDDGSATDKAEKEVILSNTTGGSISAVGKTESMFSIKEGDTVTIRVKADEGYAIDTITVFGKSHKVIGDGSTEEFDISYDMLADQSDIIDVRFATVKTLSEEASAGETSVVSDIATVEVSIDSEKTVLAGGRLVINSTVSEGEHTYQWFKDGQALIGQTGSSLIIDKVTEDDAGSYSLAVTTFAGTSTAAVTSGECKVTVLPSGETRVVGKVEVSGGDKSVPFVITVTTPDGNEVYSTASTDGSYSIPELENGDYTITFSKENCAPRSFDITMGADVVKLDTTLKLFGDLNGDGVITTVDVGMANSHVKHISVLDEYDFAVANVNKDDLISTVDCGLMNAHVKGIENLWKQIAK